MSFPHHRRVTVAGATWRIRCCLLALLSSVAAPVAAVQLTGVEITGVRDELEDNIRSRLELLRVDPPRELSDARLGYLLRQAPEQVRLAIEPYGYYSPRIEVEPVREGDTVRVRIRVDPGKPVRVDQQHIEIEGDGADDKVLLRRRRDFEPQPGEVFDHPVYEASKAQLQRSLNERGYFDAELPRHRVEVTRETRTADIFLTAATGPRYRFGETRFEGSQINLDVLRKVIPYEPGDPFHQRRLIRFHERLLALDYFAFVDIQPQPEQAGDAHLAPVDVSLTPAKKSIYTAGIGFGTDTGLSVRGGLERRWVNQRGHKLKLGAELGNRRSGLIATYRIPAFRWLPGWWSIGSSARDEEFGDFDSRIFEIVGGRSADWQGFTFAGELHARQESFLDTDVFLLYPQIFASRIESDDPLYPTEGWSATVGIAGSSTALGSDLDFVRLHGGAHYVRALGERWRLMVRGELGRLEVDRFREMPPSLRFFAGGDRSVRGYGYRELGEVDEEGRVIGGRNLVVGSIEIERAITERWGAAVFVDAGNAFNGSNVDPRVGVGVGVRWRSPVGPIRVDVGVGLDDPDSPFQLHLRIGPEL